MKKTLLILAAGMGSRYGGLKQIEKIGPSGEFIIDYSIYDAKRAGFTKVVFIIKKENYELFKETVGKRVEKQIETNYVFQNNDNVKEEYKKLLQDRTKPLGTAHAILCAKDKIKEPFAIINADDFYGYDAFQKAAEYLDHKEEKHYGLIAYHLGNTLTANGSAKRGICEFNQDKELIGLIESKVTLKGQEVEVEPLEQEGKWTTSRETLVSMNFLLFTPDLFQELEERFPKFLNKNKNNLDTCEFLIPSVLNDLVKEKKITIDILETTATWHGVTYKEDKELIVNAINKLIEEKVYPKNLWVE